MGLVVFIYMLMLVTELSVGCSFIFWKCASSRIEMECKLAVGCTITGIAVWMLVVLVCPCYMTQCDICNVMDNVIGRCSHFAGKLQTAKQHKVYLYRKTYLPSKKCLLLKRNDDQMSNNEAKTESQYTLSRSNFVLKTVDNYAVQSENNVSDKFLLNEENDTKNFKSVK